MHICMPRDWQAVNLGACLDEEGDGTEEEEKQANKKNMPFVDSPRWDSLECNF